MLEPCTIIESRSPEQHIDFHVDGKIKVLGNTQPIGERYYRITEKAYIQRKYNGAMTLMEGSYKKDWLHMSTRPDNSSPVLIDKLQLKSANTLSFSIGGKRLRSIVSSGATIYSIGIHRSLIESDLRCALLELEFPEEHRTMQVTDRLRKSIIKRIDLLLSLEINKEEFYMEVVDLVATVMSTTFLKPKYETNTSRVRIVQRATSAIANQNPGNLTPALIANLSFASVRTLEYAFQDVLSMTPKQYIDFYRINLLREKIIENPHIPIMHIGLEVGLPHLGNLSKNYKALYGETPSSTKRRLART